MDNTVFDQLMKQVLKKDEEILKSKIRFLDTFCDIRCRLDRGEQVSLEFDPSIYRVPFHAGAET